MGDPDESWVPTDLAFSWRLLHQNGARAPTVEPNPMKYTMQILEAAAECEARSWRLAPIRSRDSHSLWAKLGGKVRSGSDSCRRCCWSLPDRGRTRRARGVLASTGGAA